MWKPNFNFCVQNSLLLLFTLMEKYSFSLAHPIPLGVCFNIIHVLRGGADKSLSRPGRKQATATELGIYSNSSRSSIHFVARGSSFCKIRNQKKNQKFVRPTRSPRQQWPTRRTKKGEFSIAFSVQETGGSPTLPDPENRVGG